MSARRKKPPPLINEQRVQDAARAALDKYAVRGRDQNPMDTIITEVVSEHFGPSDDDTFHDYKAAIGYLVRQRGGQRKNDNWAKRGSFLSPRQLVDQAARFLAWVCEQDALRSSDVSHDSHVIQAVNHTLSNYNWDGKGNEERRAQISHHLFSELGKRGAKAR